jgi:molecular chaperone GrpE (heat shock protein)
LTRAREKAARDYETAVADLDQHHYLLSVAEKRYAKPSMSNEDREHERQDIEFRRREIARLENQLPKLLDALDRAKSDVEAMRATLAARGRSL